MNSQQKQLSPPQPIIEFVSAINRHSTADVLQTLGQNVVITDEGQTYQSIEEARTWCDEKCVAAMITLRMIDVSEVGDETIVAFEIDGSFDKSGLPDPFLMDFYFTIKDSKVIRLSIRLRGESST
jgi:hypothetical protein